MANIKKSLAWNLEQFDKILGKGPDIVLRRFLVGGKKPAALIFIDGLVNKIAVSDYIILPLMLADEEKGLEMEVLKEEVIGVGGISSENDENKLIDAVLAGTAVFLLDGCNEGLILDIVQWEKRSISEPDTDVVVRGPREGFIETLRINLSLLRRKIHHPALTFEMMKIGRYSKTDICLVYIKGVVNEGILVELKERLSGIKIDGILESGYIEELIEDSPFSLFPTVGSTEKPDIVAGKILEGRVAILVDGTPMALTVPMLFIEGFQCSEDYYSRFYQVSMIRILRYLAFFVNIFLPGIYVSLTTYHQQLIPVKLLLTMAAAEENTPFSVGFSLLLMGFAYEILREAGVRMPRPMGQAVSIVGAIVMGDAAVSAGLISAPVLIVVALTVISSYVTAPYANASSVLRFIYLLVGWFLGSFGLLVAVFITLLYLCSLRSFGVPYLSPLAPLLTYELKDVFVRFPLWDMQKRPRQLSKNRRRMARNLRPRPPVGDFDKGEDS